ncbi:MAG TPA: cation/H(+) antiporter, partial [Archangium sp.]|nr:cation/H(+) antiporter [Archangium sp.]
VTVLRVTVPGGEPGPVRSRAMVDELFPKGSGRVCVQEVAHASPEEAVLEEARRGYDLMVVGVGSGWGLEDGESPTSLLVVRHPGQATATEPAGDAHGVAPELPADTAA